MKTFLISESALVQVTQYLASKPYSEVAPYVQALLSLAELPEPQIPTPEVSPETPEATEPAGTEATEVPAS